MAQWQKVKFYWQTMLGSVGSTLTASSTASGYDVKNVYNMLERDMWKAGSVTPPQTITYDAGAGNAMEADYMAVLNHNVKTIGASIYLEYSDNGTSWSEAGSDTPADDGLILAEFANPGPHRYWRMRLFRSPDPFTELPYIGICIWGLRTELDYVSAGFDPYEEEIKANVTRSDTGYVLGVHDRYRERRMTLRFEDADDSLYQKIKDWWDGSGLKNFFVAWERGNRPDDIFLMMPEPRFNNPFKITGRRDITISLTGRRE